MIDLEIVEQSESPKPAQKKGFIMKLGALAAGAAIILGGKGEAEEKHDPTTVANDNVTQQDEQKEQKKESLPFQTVMQGIESTIQVGEDVVIKDQKKLNEIWLQINTDNNRPVPQIKDGETFVHSALGKQETFKGTAVTSIERIGDIVTVKITTYDLGIQNPSSPHHTVNVGQLDSNDKLQFVHENAEGQFDFSVASSAITGQAGYSPQTVEFSPKLK